MHITHKSNCSLSDEGTLCTEASTIGLTPGEWPQFISVVDDAGEGFIFGPPSHKSDCAYEYPSRTGVRLLVVND